MAWVEFGDPAARDLLMVPLLEALPRALAAAVRGGARVVVLGGRGDLWSAGYDVEGHCTVPPHRDGRRFLVASLHP